MISPLFSHATPQTQPGRALQFASRMPAETDSASTDSVSLGSTRESRAAESDKIGKTAVALSATSLIGFGLGVAAGFVPGVIAAAVGVTAGVIAGVWVGSLLSKSVKSRLGLTAVAGLGLGAVASLSGAVPIACAIGGAVAGVALARAIWKG